MKELLTNINTTNYQLLLDNRGKQLKKIAALSPNAERDAELDVSLRSKKGPIGVWLEWFLTDTKPNNTSEADAGELEIKALAVRVTPAGYKPYENMRLSIVNFNTIQHIPYEDSAIAKKSRMLVALVSKSPTRQGKDVVFYGFGYIDLEQVAEQCKSDYTYIQEMCQRGQAHDLHSSKNQPGVYLKTYSSGSGRNLSTYSAGGQICEAKGKAMYLFKDQWMELFESID